MLRTSSIGRSGWRALPSRRGSADWPHRFERRCVVAIGLISLAALLVPDEIWTVAAPMLAVWVAALAWLGMPHGGADDLVARALLRPKVGRAWLPLFLVGSFAASALVLALWVLAP